MSSLHVRRFLIAAGTTHSPGRPDFDALPELVDEIDRMERLFAAPIDDNPSRSGFGYQVVPGFGPDLRATELRDRLRSFLTDSERSQDDTVVFYYTGHGELDDDGRFLFSFPDTTEDLVGTGVPAAELARWLLTGTSVQRFLVVLDTCYSAAAGSEFSARAIAALGRLQGLTDRPHVAILTATRSRQLAYPGAFTQALERAVRHRATGGHEPEFLQLHTVVGVINNDPRKPASQRAALLSDVQGVDEFLPNPRYNQWLRGFDLRTQLDRMQREARDRETREHVLPRAQGLDTPQEGLWLFTGRHAALAELSGWLTVRKHDGLTRVVTGDPGSGKSAVLARLTVLARPELRGRVPRFEQLPPGTVPPRDGVDVFIHARGKTGDQVLGGLCAAAAVEADRPGELLSALRTRTDPLVAVIDALDEATDPDQLAEEVLAPLIRGTRHTQLRLLLGTRRHLRDRLRGPAKWIDLDTAAYADPDSIRSYVRSGLISLNSESPYRHADDSLVEATAAAVGRAAGQSFLVALITARSLALRSHVVNPYDRIWQAGLPRIAADAMSRDLDERLGDDVTKARDLLLPLAFASGTGLPWGDVWAPLASALAGRTYNDSDLDWLARNAGYYVIEALDGALSVYRLYHESLAEHLRAGQDEARIHQKITDFLLAHVHASAEGPDWAQAHPYIKSHFATHASAGGVLDDFVLGPEYLLNAERARLLAALPTVSDWSARAAAEAYRTATKHLRSKPAAQHMPYLELAARCASANDLASRIAASTRSRPWHVDWAHWNPRHDTVLGGHSGPVRSVAITETNERPVAVSCGDDGLIRAWDLTSGYSVGRTIADVRRPVQGLAVIELGKDLAVIAGCSDGTIRVWNLETGAAIGQPQVLLSGPIRALAVCEVAGRATVVTGIDGGLIIAMDLATGTIVGEFQATHRGHLASVVITELGWRPIVISGTEGGIVHIWDMASGTLERRISTPNYSSIAGLSVGELHGKPILVGGGDNGIWLWDLTTGQQISDIPNPPGVKSVKGITVGQIDGRTVVVASGDDNSIRQWDLATHAPLGEPLAGHSDWVRALSLGESDGRLVLVSGSKDSTVRLWDLGRSSTVDVPFSGHIGRVGALAVGRSNGREVVVSGADDGVVRVWDLAGGSPVGEPLTGHTDWVRTLDTVEDGPDSYVVSGSYDRSVRIWSLPSGESVQAVTDRFQYPVVAVAAGNVNGHPVILTYEYDNTVQLYDLLTGDRIHRNLHKHHYAVLAVATATTDGHPILATANNNNRLFLWGHERAKPVQYFFTTHKANRPVMELFSRAGMPMIASGDQEGLLSLWTLPRLDRRPRMRLGAHRMAKLIQIDSTLLPGPIVAIADRTDGTVAVAVGDTITLDPFNNSVQQIQLGAQVRTMKFANPHSLIAGTVQGLVSIRLSVWSRASSKPYFSEWE